MPTANPWTARIWAEYRAGTISRSGKDVLLSLATFRGAGGGIWPSHATLADRARVGVRTVIRTLQLARDLGLVVWHERRRRAGWRWLRVSNAYRLLVPEQAAPAPVRRAPRTYCQGGRGINLDIFKNISLVEFETALGCRPVLRQLMALGKEG